MTRTDGLEQKGGITFPPAVMSGGRASFHNASLTHLLALSASLGGSEAALIVREVRGFRILMEEGNGIGQDGIARLEGRDNGAETVLFPLPGTVTEAWLCVRHDAPALEHVRALWMTEIENLVHAAGTLPSTEGPALLQRLKQRVRRMSEAADVGFFQCDFTHDVLTADERFAQIWGLSPARLALGIPIQEIYDCVHPEDRVVYEGGTEEDLSRSGYYEVQFRVVLKSAYGKPFIRHLLVRGWCDEEAPEGELRSVGLVMNVSAASMTAEALRSSEAFTRLLLSSSPDCIHILDVDGVVRFVNEGGIRSMEMDSPIMLHGMSWVDLWRGQTRRLAVQAVQNALAGEIGRFQGYALTLKGTRRFWDVAVPPVFGEEGDVQRLLAIGRDLTEVNQSMERLQLALDAGAIAGTWMWDEGGAYVTGDTRLAATLRLDPLSLQQGIPASVIYDAIDERDRAAVRDAITAARRSGGKCRFQFRIMTPDGLRWFEGNGRCDLNEDGLISRFPGIVFDIDRSKRQSMRQSALVELGDALRALENAAEMEETAARIVCRELEASGAGYGVMDETGTGLVVGAPHMASPPPGMPRPRSVRGFHAFRDYGSYGGLLAQGKTIALTDVRSDPRTMEYTERFASLGIVSMLNVPLFKSGRLVGVMFVYRPAPHEWTEEEIVFTRAVADRTHAAMRQAGIQQQLRDVNGMLEERVRQRTRERDRLWSIGKDLFLIVSRTGQYQSVSPSWQNVMGYSSESLTGVRIEALCHPDDQAAVLKAFQELQAGMPWPSAGLDVRMLRRNGTWRSYNWSFNDEGDAVYGVGRDLTERNELEEQLRQSQKMEAVGQLTGGLAHDFNNLLAGIGGSLELLGLRLTQGRTEGLTRYIEASQEAVKRASSLTHRLLAFSRRQTLDPTPTDMNGLINSLVALIRGTVGPGVSLSLDLQDSLWLVRVDVNQFENAVLNLCINARDAMEQNGQTLAIMTRNRILEEDDARDLGVPGGEYVVLTVQDNGCGMAAETVKRAFDPFFTTKPQGQGTGLGLSMIYGFARQSGGQARIYSVPGEGTSVSIWLPRYHGDSASLPEQKDFPRPDRTGTLRAILEGRTVLVVDDEDTVRLVVRDVVEDLGGHVLCAADGPSVFQIIEQQPDLSPSVLISDIGMPGGMNGRQVAERLLLRFPSMKVLFITGYAEQSVLGERLLQPGCALLVKPFSVETLIAKLVQLVGQN
ncbi:PAS domain-containing protein [Gluconobacter morbifer]|uniref:histidine kinase n=1 Tax=Gluconobacter morbifer G707 TaxID=1088869 RepID=G6XF16_9PROT|nr:PAS domain-containing protein [Gluconobacter morbifer]EHH68774.1 histidine kinase-response regulator hybrid protein [Gluconobacter morbifer G707]